MNCNFKNGRSASTLLALAALVLSGNALAMGIDVGNKDVSLRWDNTVRYNLGLRVDERNSKIGNDAIADEGTYSFDQGDIVTNRLDLLSEMDFVYAGRYGVRASGAAWYDDAYSNGRSHSNPNVPLSQIPSYTGNEYSHHVKRYYRGPRSEEHTSELQSLMRISYAVFCLKKKNNTKHNNTRHYAQLIKP